MTDTMEKWMAHKKKLIEVALPLEAINKACVREKSIRHGHPSTLHLWWARRPLAAARAVIFAQMVDDPSSHPEQFPTIEAQEKERQRLFRLIEEMVQWENITNEDVLERAREEIRKSWRSTCLENKDHPLASELFDPEKLPGFHDPFAGGGALPLEAQRLGLESYASDLNPVAVLINKAMIEIPSKFAEQPPVNPDKCNETLDISGNWHGAAGLAEDVRYYGQWMREEAERRIGYLYPTVEITADMARERPDLKKLIGKRLTVIAWLWARTVASPNPAFAHVNVPLISTFWISTKTGKEAYIEPILDQKGYRFKVKIGIPQNVEKVNSGTKLARGANFRCIMSDIPMASEHIKAEGKSGRIGARMLAIVAEGKNGRVYLPPIDEHEKIAQHIEPTWEPKFEISGSNQYLGVKPYGMHLFSDLFTSRQLAALTTFSDLVHEARDKVLKDGIAAGLQKDGKKLDAGGLGAQAYADAVSVYLAFALDKGANYWSSLCSWHISLEKMVSTCGDHVFPMVWDYTEANPFSKASGNWLIGIQQITKMLLRLGFGKIGFSQQADAQTQNLTVNKVVSTDPPYYDNIPYADISDFFYVWLRRSVQSIFPALFSTLSVPKIKELVAFAYRHNNKQEAEKFFLDGMTEAMDRLTKLANPAFPITIYYAFKQSETKSNTGTVSTGWETFLEAIIKAGFVLTGTMPIRTENTMGRKTGSNSLASSIVLVCRPRCLNAPSITLREFLTLLRRELSQAIVRLKSGNIAAVDLQQAAIGPGMEVFTRYAKIIDSSGQAITVREALSLINQILDETQTEQESELDDITRWALAWFDDSGFTEGAFGEAEKLSTSTNISISSMVDSGLALSKSGKVRLLKPDELSPNWNPQTKSRITLWEIVHQIIRMHQQSEIAAANLVAKLGSKADAARDLAYRLYVTCERKKRAQEALAYNALIQSWPEIKRLSQQRQDKQETFI